MQTIEQWAQLEQKYLSLALQTANQPRVAETYLRMASRASQERIRALQAVERKNTSRDRRLVAIRKWSNA